MNFFQAILENPLLLSALIAGVLSSVAGGVIGSYVVVKRIAFIAGSIAHSVLGGIGFCVWASATYGISWLSPLHGALVAAILSALLIGWIRMNFHQREDTAIAAIWTVGMAAGIVFISLTPAYTVELSNYLIGNILWVSHDDLMTLLFMNALILGIVFLYHKKFLAICFDEAQARLQGLRVHSLYFLLLILTAITVVLLIQIVGIVLVLTLLTIPPAIANLFTRRLSHMMWIAVLVNMAFMISGTAFAYHLDWPVGATIALLAGAIYLTSLLFQKVAKASLK